MSDVIASPSTRRMALQQGVDIDARARELGRTTLGPEDVGASAAATATTAATTASAGDTSYWAVDHAAYGPVSEEPMSRFAQIAAGNLAAANALIPQVTHHDRADLTALEALRGSLRPDAQARGLRLTTLVFHIAALACCLRRFPRFNASLSPDGRTLIVKDYVHIGIAVDTPHGLMVPVIRDADTKGLWEIAGDLADLATRASARKVKPTEMGGASMTISNLGGIGGIGFTPIVNPPELAILGITRAETVTVWDGDTPRPVVMAPLDLSYDHRVINGAEAARFMAHYTSLLGDPRLMTI